VARSSSGSARREPGAVASPFRASRAFTLLELLCVIGVLAVVAGNSAMLALNARDVAADDLTCVRLAEVRNAIVRFRQDTGHLPKSGPFALTEDGGSVATPAEGEAWFRSPANLEQLFAQPLDSDGRAILAWNVDERRGWRGPYLKPGPRLVDIGVGLADDGSGSPTAGAIVEDVPAVADAHAHEALSSGIFAWHTITGNDCDGDGRPVFLIGLQAGDPILVACGANGVYERGGGDDRVLPVLR